ncbi:MAG: NTP transferase domain-containing protein [Bacteroidales bacterium]
MNYAIIAAGEGSRLAKEGVTQPKPLVELNGEKMIDRLIRIFLANQATSISVIVNEQMHEVAEYLKAKSLPVPFNLIVQSTPSSMHSFYELSRCLPEGKFCLTTVDTIFHETEFSHYIAAFAADRSNDGLFAVTDYIEDESPLYVDVDESLNIHGFMDEAYPEARYISGGIYCLQSNAFPVLKSAIEANRSRMRNYQRELVQSGFRLKAFPFKKIIDVDHASDIALAEAFLKA